MNSNKLVITTNYLKDIEEEIYKKIDDMSNQDYSNGKVSELFIMDVLSTKIF